MIIRVRMILVSRRSPLAKGIVMIILLKIAEMFIIGPPPKIRRIIDYLVL